MAGTTPLNVPPSDINSRVLAIVEVAPSDLCRVSRYNTGEPFYAKTGDRRFDDIQPDVTKRFGTCYLGFNLTVAFAETALHDMEPDASGFSVPTTEVTTRFALSFKALVKDGTLKLAQMFGTPLLLLGGNAELSGTPNYALPQAWAAALVAHPANIDGFIYMSRRVSNEFAVVLFQRDIATSPGICMNEDVKLHHHSDYAAATKNLRVSLT